MPYHAHLVFRPHTYRVINSAVTLNPFLVFASSIYRFFSSGAFHKSNSIQPTKAPSEDPLYPLLYTGGRWLHRDEEQRASRFIDFCFPDLCQKVLSLCPEASYIASYLKKEGGYNKVFIFCLDNGKQIVARLPTRAAGPPILTTSSEVATINYVKRHTTIPVPEILDWADNPKNTIGSEYIIMEHAEGVQLQERWPSMRGSQYTKCVASVCGTMKQLAALDFPAYGSIYFADAPFDSGLKEPLADGFCVGPHCSTTYWESNSRLANSTLTTPAGPWRDLPSYSSGLIANGRSKIPSPATAISRPSYFGTIEEHLSLLQSAEEILKNLISQSQIKIAAAPTLLHADLNARNIHVSNDDPTSITCLIDWQSSSIEPAFIYAFERPDFVSPPKIETVQVLPNNRAQDDGGPQLSEQDAKLQKVAEYCSQAYDICTKLTIPKLHMAKSIDQSLIRPFQYSNTSWRDSATAVRQEFLDLAKQWKDLGLEGQCPYSLSPEELTLQQKNYKAFEQVQEIKRMLMGVLDTDSDGWVPTERWEKVKSAHQDIFNLALKAAREDQDKSLTEENVRELWPFDGWKT